ncbi:MAG TPA: histidine kinase dimerization/phospho-acceptor domain-containing protein [Actinocrinis sp.]|jgi:signal transduction histidine kinase|uniref:histidine kinase dimerization/phospho-acceptor domain-containing protein n=1 Tax=Actinocrinis sp. TaxID=1920516 RepID=UPI002DDCCC0E|nr:histidine kinase dimerization/phospho-acceptor domain-containing protein [Actinocrinis sp.]HEV3171213.1 histidine kinase dimerization/phospho-acceptor domain-containing protein [Actinocrinis sp.]
MREHRHAEESGWPGGAGAVAALREALGPLDGDTGELLRDATHQLRTPLTSISGYVELLADGAAGPVTEEQALLLEAVARNTARLTALIDALEP